MRVTLGAFVAVTLGLAGAVSAEQQGQARDTIRLGTAPTEEASPVPPIPELCVALEAVDRGEVRGAAAQRAYDYLSLRCLAPPSDTRPKATSSAPRESSGGDARSDDPVPLRSLTALERCNQGDFLFTGRYFFATQAEQDFCEDLYSRRKTAFEDLKGLRVSLEEEQPALMVRIDETIEMAASDPSAANDLLRRLLGAPPPPRRAPSTTEPRTPREPMNRPLFGSSP
jgi:hypothetical protein